MDGNSLRKVKIYENGIIPDKRTLVVNIFGGPGSGKSNISANIFSELKWKHILAELALEYVKEEVWENNENAISNQLFLLGNQYQRIHRLLNKVDVIITDSPILLSILYNKDNNKNFNNYVLDKFNEHRNLNIFLERNDVEFESKGRIHNLKESKNMDNKIIKLLDDNNIEYKSFVMNKDSVKKIVYEIIEIIKD